MPKDSPQVLRNFDPELFDGKGNPRPERKVRPPEHVSGPFPMTHMEKRIKDAQENNEKLYPCCRNVENVQVNLYRSFTHFTKKGSDVMVGECQECGRKHYRYSIQLMGLSTKNTDVLIDGKYYPVESL